MDARIERFVADLPRDFAAGTIRYLNNAGLVSEDPLDVLLPHFFNHPTHHRPQAHTLPPHPAPRRRLDETPAARKPGLRWKPDPLKAAAE